MKRIPFTIALLLSFALGGIAQSTYHPLVQEGNNRQEWNVLYMSTMYYPDVYHTDIQFIDGDSIIDNMVYRHVWVQGPDDDVPRSAGFVREEDKRVYYRRQLDRDLETESLLYDFNLIAGDTITINWLNQSLIVVEEDEVEIGGTMRKRLALATYYADATTYEVEEYWIEGVGSTYGFLNSGYEDWVGTFVHLLCYHEDGDLLWQNEDYDDCSLNSGVLSFVDDVSDLKFNITGDNTVEVTYYDELLYLDCNLYTGDIVVPETVVYKNMTFVVTGIGKRAFSLCPSLNSVIVPNSVTFVGEKAFAFSRNLNSVVMSDSVVEMESGVFNGCQELTSVNIPLSLTYLPDNMFAGCTLLLSVVIPESVTRIGNGAFASAGLTSVVIPDKVESIGTGAFTETKVVTVSIPNSVKTIGTAAFERCRNLESVHLPEGLECITGYMFYGCKNLHNVNIPNSVNTIQTWAFRYCTLEGDLVFSENLVELGMGAFVNNNLTSVSFLNPMTTIKNEAFFGCAELTSVSLPSQLDTIARDVFACTGLQSISIPSSVVAINECAFGGCNGLTRVFIPQNVSSIGAGAFGECHNLKNIEVEKGNAYYKTIDGVLFNASKDVLLQYPAGKEGEIYMVPGSVTQLQSLSFAGATNLHHIDFPNTLSFIGFNAFNRCYGLQTITIPSGYIDNQAFYRCTGLTTAVIGPDVDYIGTEAFEYCGNLRQVILGNPQATISTSAFNPMQAESVKMTVVCLGDTPGNGINNAVFPYTDYQEMMIVPCGKRQVYENAWGYWWRSGNFEDDCNAYQINVTGNSGSNQVTLSSATAMLGEEVHFTVSLEPGFMLNSIEVCKADDETLKIPIRDNRFVMPNFDVVIKVHFLPLSLEEPGAEWYYEILNEDGSITYQHLMQSGDTVVQDEPTHILVRINTLYDKEQHDEVTHEYIYERNSKVYWWNKTLGEFTVLYDFGAEQGDEWEIKVGTESLVMHVDAVELYEYEGRIYKMLHVSDANALFSGDIVCGIGHLTSFFPERLINRGKGYRVEGIRCFWREGELLFKYGDRDCDEIYEQYHYGEEEPTAEAGFQIYPNPTDGLLYVKIQDAVAILEYRIINILGQTLMTGRIENENKHINVSALPAGMYFIGIGNAVQKLIIKR